MGGNNICRKLLAIQIEESKKESQRATSTAEVIQLIKKVRESETTGRRNTVDQESKRVRERKVEMQLTKKETLLNL